MALNVSRFWGVLPRYASASQATQNRRRQALHVAPQKK